MIRALFRSAGILAVGTALGQGVVLLATPLLARVYTPAAFGELALLMTVSNIAIALACLRYDLAIPAAEARHVRGLAWASTAGAVAFAFAAALLVAGAGNIGGGFTAAAQALSPATVAFCVLVVGLYQLAGAGWLREGAYLKVAMMRASQGLGFVAVATFSGIGLLWAHAVSFCSGLCALLVFRGRRGKDAGIIEAARAYRRFPLISLPGAVLDVVGYSSCIWVITASYGGEAAGHYSQIQRLIGAPMMLASISLGQVLLKQTADLRLSGSEMHAHLARLLRLLLVLAASGVLVTATIGEPVFAWLLGEGWRVDARFITLVSLAVFVRASVSPLSAALITLQRFDVALRWQGAYFASAVLLMPFMGSRLQFDEFVLFYALHEIGFYTLYAFMIFRTVRN